MFRKDEYIVKLQGKCVDRYKHRFCNYWMAMKDPDSGAVVGYRCSFFGIEKEGDLSIDECNERYGETYDGMP